MAFELTIVSNTPLTPIDDVDEVAITFLNQIGYFPKGYDPKTNAKSIRESVPYKLFMGCFMTRIDKPWQVEELATILKTSKPTVYRHINKLKSLDLLEEIDIEDPNAVQKKKAYRIRYGNLSKAWNFVETHVQVATENYRKTVDHLQNLMMKRKKR